MLKKATEGTPKIDPTRMSPIQEGQEFEFSGSLAENTTTTSRSSGEDEKKRDFEEENLNYGRQITALTEPVLRSYIRKILPHLDSVWNKKAKDSWRLKQFQKGFKARREMKTKCVLKHPLTNEQEDFVWNEIVRRFAPTYQEQRERHGFLFDVMLPEALIGIYQHHFQIKSTKEAEKRMAQTPLRQLFAFGAAGIKGKLRKQEAALNEKKPSGDPSSSSSGTHHQPK